MILLDVFAFLAALAAGFFALRAARQARAGAQAEVEAADPQAESTRTGVWRLVVAPLASRLRPTNQADLDRLTTRLQTAGRRSRDEIDRFYEEKVLAIFLGLGFGLFFAASVPGGMGALLMLASVLMGVLGADKLVDGKIAERQAIIGKALPSAVDLLVTCLDAGLSLEKSVGRVAGDFKQSEPMLAQELSLTSSEFEAGVSLPDALRRLARRVGLDELSAMCAVIAQASALGAPIAQTLREYAVASRRQRISRLEERAGRLSTRLTLPLALCLLPAALLVILGPAIVQLSKALQ
jgi:tight adherence protein C